MPRPILISLRLLNPLADNEESMTEDLLYCSQKSRRQVRRCNSIEAVFEKLAGLWSDPSTYKLSLRKRKIALKNNFRKESWISDLVTGCVNNAQSGRQLNYVAPNNAFGEHATVLLSEYCVFGVTVWPRSVGIRRERISIAIQFSRRKVLCK